MVMIDNIKSSIGKLSIDDIVNGIPTNPHEALKQIIRYIRRLISRPNKDTSHIAIWGESGAGKTTLWKQLEKYTPEQIQHSNTVITRNLGSITISSGDRSCEILNAEDVPGENFNYDKYKDKINKGLFIYYIINMCKLKDKIDDDRENIQMIYKIVDNENIENVGIKILVTNYNEYSKLNGNSQNDSESKKSKDDVKTEFYNEFYYKKPIKGVALEQDNIMVVELYNKNDIEEITKEIIKSVNKR